MISKSAYNTKANKLGLQFSSNARTAWGHIINSLSKDKKVTLLLPAYIGRNDKEGSGIFDPVLEYDTNYEFYKLNEDLSVDILDLINKIKSGCIDVILVVHYFGFCRSDMNVIQKLCKDNHVILVEDCAHAFHLGRTNQVLGNYGDFSFYSVHKYLATASGGVLKTNNPSIKLPNFDGDKKMEYTVLESYSNSNFQEIARIRRDNYLFYCKHLKTNNHLEIMFNLEVDDIPQTFPIKIKNGLRERLYFFLLENDMPTVALYYRMIEELSSVDFPTSFAISDQILNLPVHQDTNESDILKLVDGINNFFNSVN
ncbi:DegT/DnrJ/EryC1/StrS family aminotransferase [Shewanella glacialipiscicola]|uniref:DegT/DnrJ/EryC1/StrS family aminotransferase n=1 Tax=Shewanella glacialipiscicola TaxID=614069 RepID=UPI0021D8B479|nr:DegT/DnrJ/EryC1/StrS family aminotransferase [Shewanella glacialipiscicola]MCU7995610.1 DegT/DnrJ/EryC1/StrS family aminotransferase [Shewanella glacialipiscicola]MCU8026857.1 DegT/DnrJ/EryC1/StrS family aminotransferase [Shewanella glacialipiscicola]